DTTNTPATMFGESILKLALSGNSLPVLDYFTAFDQSSLNNIDSDLGSGGVLLLPDQSGNFPHLLVQVGKEGTIHLVNRDQMTKLNQHYCSGCSSDTQIVQELPSAVGEMWAMPAYWNGNVYFWGQGDVLKQYSLSNGQLSAAPTSMNSLSVPELGVTPSISSNGTSNGILWAMTGVFVNNSQAVLHAYDATAVSTELYNSDQAANGRDSLGGQSAVKFVVPIVANGKVYVGFASGVAVYGLLSGVAPPAATPQITPGSESFTGSVTVSITDSTTGAVIYYTTDGSNPLPGQGTTQQYTTAFKVTTTTTVKAMATAAGFSNSSVASATYTSQGPTIAALNPTSGPVGTSVTITGSNFGATGTVTFGGTIATTTSWTATSITTSVPTGVPTGNASVVVKVNGVSSNGVNFTVTSGGGGGGGIKLVQHTSLDAGTSGSSALVFPLNNTPGNWIAVCIRAGAINETFTVSDSNHNTYHKAIQFSETLDGNTIGIFYA